MRRIWLFLLLTGLLVIPVSAQESTAEATDSAEATVEASTPESASTVEATAEAEGTQETTPIPNRVEFPGPGSYNVREDFGTQERSFTIDIPLSYDSESDPVALVFVLHGAGGDGNGIRGISGFGALGETEGFISVFPSGINGGWNDGRPDSGVNATDDIGYIRHLIELLTNSLNIDPARIYASGYSMGGMMSFRLACNLPDQIAAVASVASTMPLYFLDECEGTPPVPVAVVQGTDDNVVPWTGIRNGYLSAIRTMEYWTNHNGCLYQTDLIVQPDNDPHDPTRVVLQQYDDCEAEVLLYGIYGGGHTWPGGGMVAPIDIGVTSQDINASEEIWAFFQRHTLNND